MTWPALYATASTASAQLYKWVDASGGVNDGDWPLAGVKLLPVNHGTLSSVADGALAGALPPAHRAHQLLLGRPSCKRAQ